MLRSSPFFAKKLPRRTPASRTAQPRHGRARSRPACQQNHRADGAADNTPANNVRAKPVGSGGERPPSTRRERFRHFGRIGDAGRRRQARAPPTLPPP